MIQWIKKVENARLTRWLAVLGFVILVVLTYLDGQLGDVATVFLLVTGVFGSMFTGVQFGAPLAKQLNKRVLKNSRDFQSRLAAALSVFAFLLLPVLFLTWAQSRDFVDIDIGPIGLHLLWAFIAAVIFFWLKPPEKP